METVAVIVLVVILVAALAAVLFAVSRNRRRAQLQERFGPEYDRVISETGNRREAEQHLAAVADKRDKLEIRDLEPRQRVQFVEQWELVQARFVDEPAAAVDGAELLITTVMRERGYPVEDFEERVDLVAADHADVVQHYRAAHDSHERHRRSGNTDTEDLRQAFVHYRSLFDSLVDRDEVEPARDRVDTGTPVAEALPETTRTDDPDRTDADRTDDPGRTDADRTDDSDRVVDADHPDQVQRADRDVDATGTGEATPKEARR
jgi:hypothetical protein